MKAYKFCLLFILVMMFFACAKKLEDILPAGKPVDPAQTDTVTTTEPTVCIPPDYGDSVLCYKWLDGKDYKVSPVNNPGKGKYISTPEGLVIDGNTGEINVTKSESGLKYKVGFIRDGYQDTCFTTVITSGINYLDGIYVLSDSDTLLNPIYNGNPAYVPICGPNGSLNGCEFDDDEDDDNGNGSADEPPAGFSCNAQNIRVDKRTGVISLKRSVLDGLFGTLNPSNGKKVSATLYYRLDDCSSGALRKIDIEFTYYSKLSDVPQGLINDIQDVLNGILNFVFRSSKDKVANPRPPHIVVVANR